MDSLRVQWVIPTGWRFLPGTSTRALSTEPLAGRSCSEDAVANTEAWSRCSQTAPRKRLPPWKRGRRNFLHPPRVLQSALSGPSEMWDGAYFNRNPPVTHKRTNISSQWFITARLHDTNSVQWCRACLLKNKQRKGKRYYFTARASGLCYDCGSTNPHTLILCTTLLYLWGRTTATVKPITALKCELVILKIIHLYTVVRFIPIQRECATHYSKLCGQYRLHHLPRLQTH